MLGFWVITTFIFGSIVGSFLNVCIYRLPRDKSLLNPRRSYCPHCHETIAWYDNIPLISYFALNAQCRHCGSYISPRYVLVEFLTAALFAVGFWAFSTRGESLGVTAVYLALIAVLIVGSFIDIELRIMPNAITIGGAMLAPVLSILVWDLHSDEWLRFGRSFMLSQNSVLGPLCASLIGAAVGAAATWLSGVMGKVLFRKEAMGFGDVKFMALLGGLLGWQQVLLVFFMAPLFGAVYGVIHLARTKDHHIPYGPFLSVATLITLLVGDRIFAILGVSALQGVGLP